MKMTKFSINYIPRDAHSFCDTPPVSWCNLVPVVFSMDNNLIRVELTCHLALHLSHKSVGENDVVVRSQY